MGSSSNRELMINKVCDSDVKVLHNKMDKHIKTHIKPKTTTVPILVIHNKYEVSKTKFNDYPERNSVSLTKLVGKTHISNFMCLGKKKQKIQKKQKKIKRLKKDIKQIKKDKKILKRIKRLKKKIKDKSKKKR